MQKFFQLGPYYFVLDAIARLYQDRTLPNRVKTVVSVLIFMTLAAIAWLGAEWLTLRIGEYPGSLGYTAMKFKYVMRLLCMECVLVSGALLATVMAQQAAKIRDYR